MSAGQPLAILLLACAVAALLAAFASSAGATVSGKYGGGRMVIIHAPGTWVPGVRTDKWRNRRVEDEVAPELGGTLATDKDHIGDGALRPGNTGCQSSSQCAAKPGGGSYTRPCTFKNQCNGG